MDQATKTALDLITHQLTMGEENKIVVRSLQDMNRSLADKVLELQAEIESSSPRGEVSKPGLILKGPVGLEAQVPPLNRTSLAFDGAPNVAKHFYPGTVHPKAVARGKAPLYANPDNALMTELWERDKTAGNMATGTHELHLPFHQGHKFIRLSFETMFIDTPENPFDWGLTGKQGGAVGFHDEATNAWRNWPGGGAHGPMNASVRLCHWRYYTEGQQPPAPRPTVYLYTGVPANPTSMIIRQRSYVSGEVDRPAYVYSSNGNHTHELHVDQYRLETNQWLKREARMWAGDANKANGRVELFINDELWLIADRIPFFGVGPATWNRVYMCFGFGGESAAYAPKTPKRMASIAYRNLEAYSE